MASKIWRNLIRTAAAACFVVGSSAQAGGVFYQSDFDPLGFAGSAVWQRRCTTVMPGSAGTGYCMASIRSGATATWRLSALEVELWDARLSTTLIGGRD